MKILKLLLPILLLGGIQSFGQSLKRVVSVDSASLNVLIELSLQSFACEDYSYKLEVQISSMTKEQKASDLIIIRQDSVIRLLGDRINLKDKLLSVDNSLIKSEKKKIIKFKIIAGVALLVSGFVIFKSID